MPKNASAVQRLYHKLQNDLISSSVDAKQVITRQVLDKKVQNSIELENEKEANALAQARPIQTRAYKMIMDIREKRRHIDQRNIQTPSTKKQKALRSSVWEPRSVVNKPKDYSLWGLMKFFWDHKYL